MSIVGNFNVILRVTFDGRGTISRNNSILGVSVDIYCSPWPPPCDVGRNIEKIHPPFVEDLCLALSSQCGRIQQDNAHEVW